MPRLKDTITGLVERLSGPYKGMPYLRYFKTEAEKKAYLEFYNKAKSGAADAPRSRRVSEGVYIEVKRSRGPDAGTPYQRFFKTEQERDAFLKRAQERAQTTTETRSAKEIAEAIETKTPLTTVEEMANTINTLKNTRKAASRSIPPIRRK